MVKISQNLKFFEKKIGTDVKVHSERHTRQAR